MLVSNLEQAGFADVSIADLDALTREQFDTLPFGVVGISTDAIVEIYNETESGLAGLPADTVIGTHFFLVTAQCMNNFMVAQRFEDEPEIDAVLDYVLTFRMRPMRVRLRLLKHAAASRYYILIQR